MNVNPDFGGQADAFHPRRVYRTTGDPGPLSEKHVDEIPDEEVRALSSAAVRGLCRGVLA